MARKQSDTSITAYQRIMQGRDSHYKKLILAMEWLVEGTSYQLAKQARLRDDQAWKRCSELVKPDENGVSIFIDTGKRGISPNGNPAIIYGLYENRDKYTTPKENHYQKGESSAADIACMIINKHENLKQKKFND